MYDVHNRTAASRGNRDGPANSRTIPTRTTSALLFSLSTNPRTWPALKSVSEGKSLTYVPGIRELFATVERTQCIT